MAQDILTTLREDHAKFKHLLSQLKETKKDDASERQEKFDELMSEILPHMEAEEQIFYPRLKESRPSVEEDVMESIEEHHVARQALEELEGMDEGEERWGPLLSVAKEMVEHHAAEEQAILFEHASKGFSDTELEQMAEEFEKARKKAKS